MDSKETGTANVVAVVAPAAAMQTYDLMGAQQLQVWTSLDPTTPEGKAAIVAHMQGDGADSVSESIGDVVPVQHVLVHRVEVLDTNTGELIDADRVVLIRPDGSSVACVSAGIRRSLQLIVNLYGMPPYTDPLHLKITQKPTRAGRRTYNLTPVVQSSVAK